VGTTAGYASGAWTAPVDGTTAALNETAFLEALEAAWTDGGDPSVVIVPAALKRKIAAFGGANKFAGVSVNQTDGRVAQAAVIGGVDLYISDFGEHKIMLNRYMRTRTILCLDPEYLATAWLRPIKFEERAKTGDATRGELLAEWCLVVGNPDAHAKVQDAS
jgi:anti-sigma factor RsiW